MAIKPGCFEARAFGAWGMGVLIALETLPTFNISAIISDVKVVGNF